MKTDREYFFEHIAMKTSDPRCFYVSLNDWDEWAELMREIYKSEDIRFGQSIVESKEKWNEQKV